MPDLRYADQAIGHGRYDEATAVTLLSIAQSLGTLAEFAEATLGACPDCLHTWPRHQGASCCGCVERPAVRS